MMSPSLRIAAAVVLATRLLPLSVQAQAPQAPPAVLRAGAAAVDITPQQFPINMPGGFSANMADSAHDPLHARALVLDDGRIKVALVVVDNLVARRQILDEVKAAAAARCGLPVENMLISSTHTHSGASASMNPDGPAAAVAYKQVLANGIAQAIVQAHEALRPASIGAGADALPEEVFNRRWFIQPEAMTPNPFGLVDQVRTNPGTDPKILLRPAGPTDPTVAVLSVMDPKGRQPLALYANYALHYVGGMPPKQVSADYFGEFARLMPARLRADAKFVGMMSNGASGNINNIPFRVNRPPREPFEQIRIVAGKAADAAWRAKQSIPAHRTDVRLGVRNRELTLQPRRPSEEMMAKAREVLAVKDPAQKEKLPRLAENYARRTMAMAEGGEPVKAPLQVVRIGDVALCAIPFEVFVEIGLELKARSPFKQTIVVGLANGAFGYLPTPEQHALGGYETWLGTNRVEERASTLITEQLLQMLAELATE